MHLSTFKLFTEHQLYAVAKNKQTWANDTASIPTKAVDKRGSTTLPHYFQTRECYDPQISISIGFGPIILRIYSPTIILFRYITLCK